MGWQENLLQNLLVIFILIAIVIIVYCKVKNITFIELFKQIKELISPSKE